MSSVILGTSITEEDLIAMAKPIPFIKKIFKPENELPEEIYRALGFAKDILDINKMPKIFYYKKENWSYHLGDLGRYYPFIKRVDVVEQKALLDTLFHELVHHKQYEAGWLTRFHSTGRFVWQGKLTVEYSDSYRSYEEYWNAPHEVHARKVAAKMVIEYNKQFN